jgi:hypothetical protein
MPDSRNSGPRSMYFVKILFQLLPYPQISRAHQYECDTQVLGGRGERSSSVKVKVTLRLTIGQSVSLGVEPHLGLMTRYLVLFDSYCLVFVGRPL